MFLQQMERLIIIKGKELELKGHPQAEKELRTAPWLRSIRLDVYTMDEDRSVYSTEVQKINTGNLVKRSRFYQALIDGSLLLPGEIDFNDMQPSYLISVMPFDLWGMGDISIPSGWPARNRQDCCWRMGQAGYS